MIHHILWQSFTRLTNFFNSVITTQLSVETKLTNLNLHGWRSLTLVHLERLSTCLCKLGLYAVILLHEERCKKCPAVGVRLQHHKSTRPHGTSHRSLALTKFSSRQHFLTENGATVLCVTRPQIVSAEAGRSRRGSSSPHVPQMCSTSEDGV